MGTGATRSVCLLEKRTIDHPQFYARPLRGRPSHTRVPVVFSGTIWSSVGATVGVGAITSTDRTLMRSWSMRRLRMFALLIITNVYFGFDPSLLMWVLVLFLLAVIAPPILLALVGWIVSRMKPAYSSMAKSAVIWGVLGYVVGVALTMLLGLSIIFAPLGLGVGILIGLVRRPSPTL